MSESQNDCNEVITCDFCHQEIWYKHIHKCPFCGGNYCAEHRNPIDHQCSEPDRRSWDAYTFNRENWKRKNPSTQAGDRAPIDMELMRVAHEVKYTRGNENPDNLIEKRNQKLIRNVLIGFGIVIIFIWYALTFIVYAFNT